MRECKDPHRFCYKYDGQCCMDCKEVAECEKGCSWTYRDCFLAIEVQQFKEELAVAKLLGAGS
jgi:hypothetical protein